MPVAISNAISMEPIPKPFSCFFQGFYSELICNMVSPTRVCYYIVCAVYNIQIRVLPDVHNVNTLLTP